jgi:hypothetical protein
MWSYSFLVLWYEGFLCNKIYLYNILEAVCLHADVKTRMEQQ